MDGSSWGKYEVGPNRGKLPVLGSTVSGTGSVAGSNKQHARPPQEILPKRALPPSPGGAGGTSGQVHPVSRDPRLRDMVGQWNREGFRPAIVTRAGN